MSHRVLQQLVVRLLYDPELVERIYADPERALSGLELTAAERRMAVAPDRRAYGADRHRRSRTLTELLREYPAAASFVAPTRGGIALLDRFFSSGIFHAAIMERRSLAAAFGDYLQAIAREPGWDPRLSSFARLEQAIARVRRVPFDPSATALAPLSSPAPLAAPATGTAALPAWLVRPARVELLTLPAGTLEQHGAVLAALTLEGADPVASLLAERAAPPPAPPPSGGEEPLLVEAEWPAAEAFAGSPPVASIRVGAITPELASLLAAAAPPGIAAGALGALARALGADPGEEAEILGDLLAQHLLVPGPPPFGTPPASTTP